MKKRNACGEKWRN